MTHNLNAHDFEAVRMNNRGQGSGVTSDASREPSARHFRKQRQFILGPLRIFFLFFAAALFIFSIVLGVGTF